MQSMILLPLCLPAWLFKSGIGFLTIKYLCTHIGVEQEMHENRYRPHFHAHQDKGPKKNQLQDFYEGDMNVVRHVCPTSQTIAAECRVWGSSQRKGGLPLVNWKASSWVREGRRHRTRLSNLLWRGIYFIHDFPLGWSCSYSLKMCVCMMIKMHTRWVYCCATYTHMRKSELNAKRSVFMLVSGLFAFSDSICNIYLCLSFKSVCPKRIVSMSDPQGVYRHGGPTANDRTITLSNLAGTRSYAHGCFPTTCNTAQAPRKLVCHHNRIVPRHWLMFRNRWLDRRHGSPTHFVPLHNHIQTALPPTYAGARSVPLYTTGSVSYIQSLCDGSYVVPFEWLLALISTLVGREECVCSLNHQSQRGTG